METKEKGKTLTHIRATIALICLIASMVMLGFILVVERHNTQITTLIIGMTGTQIGVVLGYYFTASHIDRQTPPPDPGDKTTTTT